MSKNQISFKIIDNKPNIPNPNDYYYKILCYETNFKDIIYCSKMNKIFDIANLNKCLKYIIKLMKKGKILGVGNLMISQEIFTKKIKRKKYNNISIFMTDDNYKKIFPKVDLTKLNINKNKIGISLSIEINIKYNVKEKDLNNKKFKLIRRNFSFQGRAKYKNDYSIKSSNNYLTTSTTNINTYNYINGENLTENNINYFSSDKNIINTPEYLLSPPNISSPLSEPNINTKAKKKLKKGIYSHISFKNDKHHNKNKNNFNYNIFDFKSKEYHKSSRNNNNKFLTNKKKLNILITQESSSSKNSNTLSQTSIIDSILIEKNLNFNNSNNEIINSIPNINNNDTIQNMPNILYKNEYNKDNDTIDNSDYYLKVIEKKKNKLLEEQNKRNKKLFIQEEIQNRLISTANSYENKIKINKIIVNRLREKNDLLNYKEEIIYNMNKEIIPIISKVKESQEIEASIFNLFLKKNINNTKAKNSLESNIEKYDKNLMIKILKNVIQGQHNIDVFLNDENKKKLNYICEKYNIFGSIIEEIDE